MDIIFQYSIGYHTRTHDYKDTQKSHYQEIKGIEEGGVGGHEGVGSDKGIRREHNYTNTWTQATRELRLQIKGVELRSSIAMWVCDSYYFVICFKFGPCWHVWY